MVYIGSVLRLNIMTSLKIRFELRLNMRTVNNYSELRRTTILQLNIMTSLETRFELRLNMRTVSNYSEARRTSKVAKTTLLSTGN